MKMQAHRGVCTECPENTMPAFQRALEQGYPIIELDPKFTADDICVVLHDHTINRTCRTAEGEKFESLHPICEISWEEAKALDAGLWFGEKFKGTKIPLLSEVLAFAKEHGIHIKIDNVFVRFPEHQQQILFEIVEASGADAGFTCPDIATIEKVVARFPKATIHYDGYVDEETVIKVKSCLKENHLIVWLPFDNKITAWCTMPKATPERCAMVKQYAELGVWILHEEEDRALAESMGADIIETTGSLKP
jgi:hypothetical protein